MPKNIARGYTVPVVGDPGAPPSDFERLGGQIAADVTGLEGRIARQEAHQGLQRRSWTSKTEADKTTSADSVYDWPAAANTGGWQDPFGASFIANVIAGHLYEVKTVFSAAGGNPTTKRILRVSLWAASTELEETEAHIGGDLIPIELSGEFRSSYTGTIQIRTRIAVNGTLRILRYYQSPATRVLDHGYRSA